jgi:hypothetical protein
LEATQLVVLVEDQVNKDEDPEMIVVGFAENVRLGVGGGFTVTVTDLEAAPPGPSQVKE